jgi:hypothetical protein
VLGRARRICHVHVRSVRVQGRRSVECVGNARGARAASALNRLRPRMELRLHCGSNDIRGRLVLFIFETVVPGGGGEL